MSSLSEILLAQGVSPAPNSRAAFALKRQGVPASLELDRILALPRRAVLDTVPDLTPLWAKPEGRLKLWPIQSWALLEAEAAGGIFGAIGCGGGKTLLSILCVDALRSTKALLLIPPQLRSQLLYKDIPFYSKHFNLEDILRRLKIMAYSELSQPKSAEILDQLKPDLIIADEAHNIRDHKSARTSRILRYFKENPSTRLVALSGTMTRKSILDYAHLLQFALRDSAPLPRGFRERREWAEALDVSDDPMPAGQLVKFVTPQDVRDDEASDSQPVVRRAYRRRLVETKGVVSTSEDALGNSLIIQALYPTVPHSVLKHLEKLRLTGEHNGEVLEDPKAIWRVGNQLGCGFYYQWVWPDDKVDHEWLEARANWHRELRTILNHNHKGMDSPFLVGAAAAAGRIDTEHWAAWAAVKHRPVPPTEPVWIDEFLIDECRAWAVKLWETKHAGVIWYTHSSFGELLAKRLQLPFFGPGAEASKLLSTIDAKTARIIVCSIAAHGEGKNLQQYSRMLITTPPSSAKTWEQTVSRLHRPGQEADDVIVDVFLHTEHAKGCLDTALNEARYVTQTQGSSQKLLMSTRIMK